MTNLKLLLPELNQNQLKALERIINEEIIESKIKIGVSDFHPTKDEVKQVVERVRASQREKLRRLLS